MGSEPFTEKVLNRETLYSGSYLKLEKLSIETPHGRAAVREIVRVRDAVAVLPVDAEGFAHLVRQHRPAIGRTIIEIPAGVLDPGESPEICAGRECEEETGIVPGKLQKLVTYAHAEGYSTGWITLFLATELTHTGKTTLDYSEYVEQVKMPFTELQEKIKTGEIVDSKTILATLLSRSLI